MGIKGLNALIAEHAPNAIKEYEMKTLFGRKVAIDASMSIYQFLIAVRSKDGEVLTNEAGETTSHLMGFFYRTIRMVENGLKPAYVFDGKPPELKSGVLAKRFERRKEATEQGEEAKEIGTTEDVDRLSRRTVRVTKEHNAECQRLLKLMGIPCIVAPSEAEAQCAELARGGKVFAAGSEDMDTLTFNASVVFRHLTFSEAKKMPIAEITLARVLEGFEMNMEQFVELCILLGCDYLEPIKGVGPKSALKLLKDHGGLGNVIESLREKQAEREEANAKLKKEEPESDEDDKMSYKDDDDKSMRSIKDGSDDEGPPKKKQKTKKVRVDNSESEGEDEKPPSASEEDEEEEKPKPKPKKSKKKAPDVKGKGKAKGGITVPEYWPWEEAKALFLKPDVTPADQLELIWEPPNVDGLFDFLVREKGFNEDRVRKGAEKLSKMMNSKQQGRLDGFFTFKPKEDVKSSPPAKTAGKGAKRKAEEKEKASGSKKKVGKK